MDARTKTRVAYRCPYCASVISIDVTERMIENKFHFACTECKKSNFDLSLTPSGSIKVIVPCLMCPHPHPYTVSKEIFFERDIFILSCSFTGLDICFMGNENEVEDEIDRSGAEISALTDEEFIGDENKKSADMMVADTSVMREVLFAIGNLEAQKKISCVCKSKAVKVIVDYDKAVVVCKVCARKIDVPARNRFDANNAIDLESIIIT